MSTFKTIAIAALAGLAIFHVTTWTNSECANDQSRSIPEIKQASSQLNKSTVHVSGTVTTTFSTPLLKYYFLQDDNSEEILVKVKKGGFVPERGSPVQVCAEVRELYSINGEVKSVVLIELDRAPSEEGEENQQMDDLHSVMIEER